jgi:hypothetical protein
MENGDASIIDTHQDASLARDIPFIGVSFIVHHPIYRSNGAVEKYALTECRLSSFYYE